MTRKTIIRIIGAVYLLPGFVFDTLFGFAFILSDGKPEGTGGDWLGEWIFMVFNSLPDILKIIIYPTFFICAIPAGIVCLGVTLGFVFGCAYILNGVIGSLISIPFTGKIQWVMLSSLAD